MAGFSASRFSRCIGVVRQTRRHLGWLMKSNGGDSFHCFFHSEETLRWKGKTAFSPFGFGREKRIFAFIFHEYAENSGKIFAFFSCIQSNGGCDDPVRIDLSSRQLQCLKHVSQTQKRTGNQFPNFFFVPRINPLLLLQSCRQIHPDLRSPWLFPVFLRA